MLFDETGRIFNASVCGDNCAKWILKIAESKDLTINLRHIMEFGDDEFEMSREYIVDDLFDVMKEKEVEV